MNHYITIRRGKKSHVIAGPFETLQTAKLMRFKYFFTVYDRLCDETPERLTINHSHSFPIPCASVETLTDWHKGSLHGSSVEEMPRVEPGTLFSK